MLAYLQRLHRANEWDTISTGVVHKQTASLELTMPTFGLQEEISPALEPTQTQNYHRVSLAVRNPCSSNSARFAPYTVLLLIVARGCAVLQRLQAARSAARKLSG